MSCAATLAQPGGAPPSGGAASFGGAHTGGSLKNLGGGASLPQSSLIGGPTPATARQGRHKQRYAESGERLVAGCV
jgi:hypothetical protein